MTPKQLAELREYHKNPQIHDLNRVATKQAKDFKELNLPQRPRWPECVKPGATISYLERQLSSRRALVWKEKQGRVFQLTDKVAAVDLGKYKDSILLANLHNGSVKLVERS